VILKCAVHKFPEFIEQEGHFSLIISIKENNMMLMIDDLGVKYWALYLLFMIVPNNYQSVRAEGVCVAKETVQKS
jgi:hypothetical protein